MHIQAECRPCLVKLVDMTVELATENPAVRKQTRRDALEIISQEFTPAAIPACIANKFHRHIKQATGNPDPFHRRKQQETEMLREVFTGITSDVGWPDDLLSLLSLAVAGNALDFFRTPEEILHDLRMPITFVNSDLELLASRLAAGSGLMLYLADNAGEQFFDRPVIEFWRRQGWEVIYVVKGGPIQNDLTLADLQASGLGPALEPVAETGALTVGLVREEASPGFCRLLDRADIILAKGMGHFETLSHHDDPRVFFLLQAKCRPVAAALQVPVGSFVVRSLSAHA
jgi:hypothetical protein